MPFINEKQKVCQTHKADWELFKYKLDSQISVINLDNKSVEQLENAITNWIKVVKMLWTQQYQNQLTNLHIN